MRRKHSREDMVEQRKVYELTEEELHEPITKEIGRQCKHRLERRWYRRLIELNILIIVAVIIMFAVNFSDYKDFVKQAAEQIQEEMDSVNEDDGTGEKDAKKDNETKEDKDKKKLTQNN